MSKVSQTSWALLGPVGGLGYFRGLGPQGSATNFPKQVQILVRAAHCPPPPLLSQTPELRSHGIVDGGGREAIEGGAHDRRVGAHEWEDQPVAHIQLRQLHLLQEELVQGITRGAKEGAREEGRLGAELLQGHGGGKSKKIPTHIHPYPLLIKQGTPQGTSRKDSVIHPH